MRSIGGLMVFLGAFAFILNFVDRKPSLLFWIYEWGDMVAYGIMGGFVVVGGLLYVMGGSGDDE